MHPSSAVRRLAAALSRTPLQLPCLHARARRRLHRASARSVASASQPPVLHLDVPAPGGPLAALVAAATGLPDAEARALINLGAVYSGTRDAPLRSTKAAQHVAGGAYLRVHARPRRFPAAKAEDWASRVLHRGDGLVLMHKPAGLPCSPGVDNSRECVAACVAVALRCAPLRVIHRLDNCTSGVLALAETKAAAQRFGQLQRSAAAAGGDGDGEDAAVVKVYRALTCAPVALGPQRAWVQVGHKAPGAPRRTLVFDAPGEGRVSAAQEVLACVPHAPGVWDCALRLRTGRTHQVRALLAHVGAPIVGDTLYGVPDAQGWREPEAIALHAAQLEMDWGGGERRVFAVPPPWATASSRAQGLPADDANAANPI